MKKIHTTLPYPFNSNPTISIALSNLKTYTNYSVHTVWLISHFFLDDLLKMFTIAFRGT